MRRATLVWMMTLGSALLLVASGCAERAMPVSSSPTPTAPVPSPSVPAIPPPPVPSATPTPTPVPPSAPSAPPRFDLEPGVYVGAQTVAISGEPGASIRYTLDGTAPGSDHGTIYTGPFLVSGRATTVKAVVVGEGRQTSEVVEATYRVFDRAVDSAEPIVLEGDAVMEIVGTYFVHENDIVLHDNARLVIRDSLIEHRHQFAFQYGLAAYGNSQVVFEDSELRTSCTGSLNWNFFDDSAFTARDIDMTYCNTWSLFTDRARATIEDWDGFGGTICNQADVTIHRSRNMEIELCYPEGAVVDEELPLEIAEFVFPNENDVGVTSRLRITESSAEGWGIGIGPRTHATFRDSPSVTVSVVVGYPWQGETVLLVGLDKKLYEDQTWEIVDSSLRLINTRTYGWEVGAWGGNTVVVRDSDFTGPTLNGGYSFETVEDSTLAMVRGQDHVEITVRRSTINGDVIATENATITLIDCLVESDGDQSGNVIATDNGTIVLVNTTVQGETRMEKSGQIIVR